jgi:hypothetical protein
MRGRSTMDLVALVVRLKNEYKPDAIFVDGDGLGGPVIDRLRELRVEVFDIKGNGKADRGSVTRSPGTCAGRRTRTIVSAATGAAVSPRVQSRSTPLSEFLNPLDLGNYPKPYTQAFCRAKLPRLCRRLLGDLQSVRPMKGD